MVVKKFQSNKILTAQHLNDSYAAIAATRVLGFKLSDGTPPLEFNIGDLTAIANGSLVGDILMRDTKLIKMYNAAGALLRSKDPTIFAPSQGAEKTIAAGVITITADQHTVDTQADDATDDLNTINGASTGQILIFSNANNARAVVFKHGTGNIITPNGKDITLRNTDQRITGTFDGTNYIVLTANKVGDVVQTQYNSTANYTNATGTDFPLDDTKPQSNEGTEILTRTITLEYSSNKVIIKALVQGTSPLITGSIGLFQDSIVNALNVSSNTGEPTSANGMGSIYLEFEFLPATASEITFKIRASNMFVNGGSGGRLFGGANISFLKITEIQQ